MGPGRGERVDLASAPIDVGPALREQLYDKVPTVILTSATLSVGGRAGFTHFQRRLGLDDCATLQLGSPFNYREPAELHLFRTMPDPTAAPAAFEDAVLAKVQEYVLRTRGRAFVLFTSYGMMQKAATRLGPWLLPPAEDLARGVDLRKVSGKDGEPIVALVPRGAETARDVGNRIGRRSLLAADRGVGDDLPLGHSHQLGIQFDQAQWRPIRRIRSRCR